MNVIVGLGNPGKEYEKTRHNVGFLCVDYLQSCWGFEDFSFQEKFQAEVSTGMMQGTKTMLVKPMTFMNLSGEAVSKIVNYYKVDIADVVVIYDDVDFDFGVVKMKPEGSPAGQKGMKNIIDHLGTNAIARVRIGIEARGENTKFQTSDFVLSTFKPHEEDNLDAIFIAVEEGLQKYYQEGIENAMNTINAFTIS